MSEVTRTNQAQKSMVGYKKGAGVLSDILMKHRTGQLPSNLYFKDERGHKRIKLDEAAEWSKRN